MLDIVIIGAGPAGLAAAYDCTSRDLNHVYSKPFRKLSRLASG